MTCSSVPTFSEQVRNQKPSYASDTAHTTEKINISFISRMLEHCIEHSVRVTVDSQAALAGGPNRSELGTVNGLMAADSIDRCFPRFSSAVMVHSITLLK